MARARSTDRKYNRQIFNISRTKSQNLTVPRLVFPLTSCVILKPGVQSRMKM